MKGSKRLSRILLGVSVLVSIPVFAAASNNKPAPPPPPRSAPPPSRPAAAPSRPSYSPPPSRPSYNSQPSRPSYNTQPSRPSYNSQPSSPYSHPSYGGARPANPSSPVHSYTPGAPSAGYSSNPRPSSGGTTYTPHTYTPGSSAGGGSAASHGYGNTSVSGEGVRNSNGVTTYTPHASGGSSYAPAVPPVSHANTYAPSSPPVAHGNTYTPSSPSVAHGNSYSPGAPTAAGSAYAPHSLSAAVAARGEVHPVYHLPASATAGRAGSGGSSLTPVGSQSVLRQVNGARSGLTGLNKRPIPQGQVSVHANHSLTVTAANGRKFDLRANGTLAGYSAHGQTASFRGNGHLASAHTSSMDITRGARGQRTVVSVRPDHSRLVSTGRHSGYLQRSVVHHGRTFNQRTYVQGGHRVTRDYASYRYHGLLLDDYVPLYYYDPDFYGWAYYPWGVPGMYACGLGRK